MSEMQNLKMAMAQIQNQINTLGQIFNNKSLNMTPPPQHTTANKEETNTMEPTSTNNHIIQEEQLMDGTMGSITHLHQSTPIGYYDYNLQNSQETIPINVPAEELEPSNKEPKEENMITEQNKINNDTKSEDHGAMETERVEEMVPEIECRPEVYKDLTDIDRFAEKTSKPSTSETSETSEVEDLAMNQDNFEKLEEGFIQPNSNTKEERDTFEYNHSLNKLDKIEHARKENKFPELSNNRYEKGKINYSLVNPRRNGHDVADRQNDRTRKHNGYSGKKTNHKTPYYRPGRKEENPHKVEILETAVLNLTKVQELKNMTFAANRAIYHLTREFSLDKLLGAGHILGDPGTLKVLEKFLAHHRDLAENWDILGRICCDLKTPMRPQAIMANPGYKTIRQRSPSRSSH